ncbi:MAG: alpha/beta hydrolase [Nevskia sp.]|nr:alpha/beta hydrolase [Nevskia sp.]
MRALFLVLASLLAVSACSSRQLLNATASDSGYTLSQNVVYDDSTGLKLDVYAPEGAANAPVVVFFFGGRWSSGDKQDFKFVGQAMAARGFVAVIPNYRLYPQVHYPDFVYDSARAVVWTHQHIASYGGGASRIVVMGHSSGAYNAAMLALDPEFLLHAGGNRNWVRGMIGLAGPYDFLPLTDPDLRELLGPPESYDRTQPVFHVDGNNPPLLLMHGGKDETIDIKNTQSLFDRIKRAGGTADMEIYPGLDHSRILDVVGARLQGNATVMDKVDAFVRRVTVGNAPATAQPSSIQTYVPPK